MQSLKLNSDLVESQALYSTMYVKVKNVMTGEELMLSTSKLTSIRQIKEDVLKK